MSRRGSAVLGGVFLWFALVSSAMAQGTQLSIGSLTHDTSLPVEVSADSLAVANDSGSAVFDGNVVVVQGPMRLAAGRIEIDYAEDQGAGRTSIREMRAIGGVTYANGQDAAEAGEAIYRPDSGTLVMSGNVLLTQGPSVISGDRLTVDLASGTGTMEGRVRTVINTGDGG